MQQTNPKKFDVETFGRKRVYHFNSYSSDAAEWTAVINKVIISFVKKSYSIAAAIVVDVVCYYYLTMI
jgi:hypothetical protein